MSTRPQPAEPMTISRSETITGADVLIVIPSLNEEAHIESVIATLQADRRCSEALIVVSDGGSSDQTVAIVKRIGSNDPRVRVLTTVKRLSIGASVNRAVECFGHGRTWLARLDAHAGYPKDYVSRLIAKAIETGAKSVVTTMFTRGDTCFQRAAAAAQNSFLGTGGSAHRLLNRGGWVEHGHHAIFDLERFRELGGYDGEFNEDAEFDWRLIKSGGRIWLADDLVVTYFPRSNTISLFRQYVNYGRGRARTFIRHGGRKRIRHFILPSIAPIITLGFLAPLYWPVALPVSAWLFACLSYGLVLGIRQRDVCAAASGYAAIVMQLAWSLGHWREIISIRARTLFRPSLSAADAAHRGPIDAARPPGRHLPRCRWLPCRSMSRCGSPSTRGPATERRASLLGPWQ
jgi:succinoglycan biosynthesis protein ExoA